mmetsp:Transcript_130548/g.260499  ORF Transcript_130548/g.260499 Transcript_130548/m.260499 type:complete len:98 (+) Transcript_130548:156-449(+)
MWLLTPRSPTATQGEVDHWCFTAVWDPGRHLLRTIAAIVVLQMPPQLPSLANARHAKGKKAQTRQPQMPLLLWICCERLRHLVSPMQLMYFSPADAA